MAETRDSRNNRRRGPRYENSGQNTYIDEQMEAAVQQKVPARSTLEDVVRAMRRKEGESTDAMLARLLARAFLNKQLRNEVSLYHVIPDLNKNIENFSVLNDNFH